MISASTRRAWDRADNLRKNGETRKVKYEIFIDGEKHSATRRLFTISMARAELRYIKTSVDYRGCKVECFEISTGDKVS